jgi:general L-amino acid transport system permease protein
MSFAVAFVRSQSEPQLRPPLFSQGALAWAKKNLFSSVTSTVITILFVAAFLWTIPDLVAWATVRATWVAPDGALCRQNQDGACWAFIGQKLGYLSFGSYPEDQRWRVDVVEALGAVLIVWLLWPRIPAKRQAAWAFFLIYPVVSYFLLVGARALDLPHVDTLLWGGVFVSLITAVVGIVVSLPLGVLLALGRRSPLPAVRLASVIFIEFVRGVPFITVLFMANNVLPLFLPAGWEPDRYLRPLVGIALFSAAYMAEEVRGGLQTLSKGQYEGAMALGLDYGRMMRLVVLPQALALVIPGIVNNFIGLFKDTTLVAIVGVNDFLATMDNAFKDPVWAGPSLLATGYIFAAMFYFVFCYAMSAYSAGVERRLSVGRRR